MSDVDTLREFLLNDTMVGDIVWFTVDGWYVGCTYVDRENIFVESLNIELLDMVVDSWEDGCVIKGSRFTTNDDISVVRVKLVPNRNRKGIRYGQVV